MSMKRIPSVYRALIVFVVTAYLVGCATTGPQRAAKMTSSMRDTRDELVLTKQQVRATMATLNNIVGKPGSDIGMQYDQFVKEVKNTDKQVGKLRNQTDKMNAQSRSHFEAWQKSSETIQNPDIRKKSDERRAKAFDSYKKIDVAMQSVNEALDPFLSDLKDIQRYLGSDLTAQGIASISDAVKKAGTNAATVQKRIDAAIAQIDRVAAEMSTTLAPETGS